MLPKRNSCSVRRVATLLVAAGCCLASIFPPLPVVAQAAKADLIPLVIPSGPSTVRPGLPIPDLPVAMRPQPAPMHAKTPLLVTTNVPDFDAEPAAQAVFDVAPNAAAKAAVVRATELRGLLPHPHDRHYFGLESIQPGDAFALTLTVEPAAALLDAGSVNFVVLTANGLQRFLAGADPLAVNVAVGSPMIFDQVGNRLTALVPGSSEGGYTVIVFNHGQTPVTYVLHAQGGLLRDDAGQTFAAVTVDAAEGAVIRRSKQQEWAAAPLFASGPDANHVPTEDESAVAALLKERAAGTGNFVESLPVRWTEPVRARRLSGTLIGSQTQHFFTLAAEGAAEEILLSMQLPAGSTGQDAGFWVLTQDGVRSMILGGLPQELNLAAGIQHPLAPGRYEARLRLARQVLYTVVVYHAGELPTDYALSVQGGVLVDQYGQTNEAYAAALEVWALSSK